ncbi:hypothetical protein CcCBS67573_g02262 [Chytriomyces confervae]|uniref:Nitroreductase domain-containing protein n=1 Tax=Chytriomyces confervae TaxID=246404 RepID=A0A507FM15_9FUNG|nr:hypothetical protein CcCBS67573_g02262 [Chytriomyces confervae]
MGFLTNLARRVLTAEDPALTAAVVLLTAATAYIYIKESTSTQPPALKAVLKKKAGKPSSLPSTLAVECLVSTSGLTPPPHSRAQPIAYYQNTDLDNTPFMEITEIAEAEATEDFHDPFDLPHVPFNFDRLSHSESMKRSLDFYKLVNGRRSLRMFSEDPVPIEVIRNCCMAAATAPSGAHTEPWTFAIIHTREMKAEIRQIIEHEERINYESRMSQQWVSDLAKLRTNWEKEYLETAPYLIVVFKQAYGIDENGKRVNHYYYEQSNSIACGILITALHNAGLVTLTSTPMNAGPAIRALLDRPVNEKVQLLLPVGYPASNATVPDLKRKPASKVLFEY